MAANIKLHCFLQVELFARLINRIISNRAVSREVVGESVRDNTERIYG